MREEIIKMAREAGFKVGPSRDGPDDVWGVGANLERFFHMAQAAEREACAMECVKLGHSWTRLGAWGANNEFQECADAIRAREQT